MRRLAGLLLICAIVLTGCTGSTKTATKPSEEGPPAVGRTPAAFVLATRRFADERHVWVVTPSGTLETSRSVPGEGRLVLSPDARRILYTRPAQRKTAFMRTPSSALHELDIESGRDTLLADGPSFLAWGYDASGGVVAVSGKASNQQAYGVPLPPVSDLRYWRGASSELTSAPVVLPDGKPVRISTFISADPVTAWFGGAYATMPGSPNSGSAGEIWRLDLASGRISQVYELAPRPPGLPSLFEKRSWQGLGDELAGGVAAMGGRAAVVLEEGALSKANGGGVTILLTTSGVDLVSLETGKVLRSFDLTPTPGFHEGRQFVLDDTAERYLETIPRSGQSTAGAPPKIRGEALIAVPERIAEVDVRTGKVTFVVPQMDYVAMPIGYVGDDGSFLYRATEGTRAAVFLMGPDRKKGRPLLSFEPPMGIRSSGPVLLGVRYRD